MAEETIEQKISKDLEFVRSRIRSIETGELPNGLVISRDYPDPVMQFGGLPTPEPGSALAYFKSIEEGLVHAQDFGFIPKAYANYFLRAPREIRGLVVDDNPNRIA